MNNRVPRNIKIHIGTGPMADVVEKVLEDKMGNQKTDGQEIL